MISNSSEKKASVYTNSHDFWDYQWDMKYVTNNGESYALYQPSKKISVGIIDSGIMEEHPDLSNSLGNYFKNLVPKGGFDNEEPDETGNQVILWTKWDTGRKSQVRLQQMVIF